MSELTVIDNTQRKRQRHERKHQRQATDRVTAPPNGTDLQASVEQFLVHLRDYRGCSERTIVSYRQDAMGFISFLSSEGISAVEQVQKQHAHRFAARLTHLAPASIRRRIYALRSWFRYLVDDGVLDSNPVALVELPKRRLTLPRVPTQDQCEALLAACATPREKAVVALLLMGGLRKAELLALHAADVSAGCEQIRVMGKGRKERMVPLCPHAREAVENYLEERRCDSPFLICNRIGGPLGTNSFYRLMRRLLRRAGLSDNHFTPHSLRHAFGTYLVRAGVDIATVAELMGHSNISTTSIYLHSDTTTKRAAVERLPWSASSDGVAASTGEGVVQP